MKPQLTASVHVDAIYGLLVLANIYGLYYFFSFSKRTVLRLDETYHSPLKPAASNLCLYHGLLAALRQTAIPPTFNTLFISSIS